MKKNMGPDIEINGIMFETKNVIGALIAESYNWEWISWKDQIKECSQKKKEKKKKNGKEIRRIEIEILISAQQASQKKRGK